MVRRGGVELAPVVVAGVAVLVVLALVSGAVVLSRTLKPRQRLALWIGIVLAALYLVPRFYQAFQAGYRVGAELREQQNQ